MSLNLRSYLSAFLLGLPAMDLAWVLNIFREKKQINEIRMF